MDQTYGIGKKSQPGLTEISFVFSCVPRKKSYFPQTMDVEPYEMRKYIHLWIFCVFFAALVLPRVIPKQSQLAPYC